MLSFIVVVLGMCWCNTTGYDSRRCFDAEFWRLKPAIAHVWGRNHKSNSFCTILWLFQAWAAVLTRMRTRKQLRKVKVPYILSHSDSIWISKIVGRSFSLPKLIEYVMTVIISTISHYRFRNTRSCVVMEVGHRVTRKSNLSWSFLQNRCKSLLMIV